MQAFGGEIPLRAWCCNKGYLHNSTHRTVRFFFTGSLNQQRKREEKTEKNKCFSSDKYP